VADIEAIIREAIAIDREDAANDLNEQLERLRGDLLSDMLPRLTESLTKGYPDEQLALQAYHAFVRLRTLSDLANTQ
jgi:methionyl-tRNA formyltransferase